MAALHFPPGFLWGTATSAHQVEGWNTNNQWWAWEQEPGRIWHNDRSGAACDWWQHAEADFDRMAALGQNAHRLSIEWSRVEPRPGVWDTEALARYRRMVQGLCDRGIKPMITLHHFTNPNWLQARGGWRDPATPAAFARFAARAASELGDLCDLWCTLNEPNIYAAMGYLIDTFPPGAGDPRQARRVLINMLRGHAAAVHAVHAVDPQLKTGLVHHVRLFDPATISPADVAVAALRDIVFNDLIVLALRTNRLPPPLGWGQPLSEAPCVGDFVGLNYYTRERVRFDRTQPRVLWSRHIVPDQVARSDAGRSGMTYGEVYAAGLLRALRKVSMLGVPIYITENGLPDADDDLRPQFLLAHLAAVHQAIAEGIDVRGFFHWSLIDNFEWAEGWGLRFGLYALDQYTQQRTLRRSGALYAAIARANAIPHYK